MFILEAPSECTVSQNLLAVSSSFHFTASFPGFHSFGSSTGICLPSKLTSVSNTNPVLYHLVDSIILLTSSFKFWEKPLLPEKYTSAAPIPVPPVRTKIPADKREVLNCCSLLFSFSTAIPVTVEKRSHTEHVRSPKHFLCFL